MKRFRIETKIPVASQITSSSFARLRTKLKSTTSSAAEMTMTKRLKIGFPAPPNRSSSRPITNRPSIAKLKGRSQPLRSFEVARPHAPMASVVSAVAPAAWTTAPGSASA